MGCIPPSSMALSKKEFDKKVTNGAKTFEEIDPEFCKWNKEMYFLQKVGNIILYSGLLLGLAFVIMWFLIPSFIK